MPDDIAFLHTAAVHVATFTKLVADAAPALRQRHIVNEALLVDAQRDGANDPAIVARAHAAMHEAAANGARVVVCTCSTIGGAAESTVTNGRFIATRVDRAMADRAVLLGPRVLVLAALASTLEPTKKLLESSQMRANVTIDARYAVVGPAWSHFINRDLDAYYAAIVAQIERDAPNADVIVLAQASMAPAAELSRTSAIEVLSSPASGVQHALALLRHESHDSATAQP